MWRPVHSLPVILSLACLTPSLVACGGSEVAAQSPSDFPPAERPAAEDAAPESEPAAAAADDSAWEGEAEATGKASSGPQSNDASTSVGKGEETRTTELIAKLIKDNRKPFRDCYEKGRKELPDLEGTLTLHFVLDPAGKVKLAELNAERSEIKSPVVTECAVGALKAMTFPPSSRGMESAINYPFDFKR